jgi:hypothetical protein
MKPENLVEALSHSSGALHSRVCRTARRNNPCESTTASRHHPRRIIILASPGERQPSLSILVETSSKDI